MDLSVSPDLDAYTCYAFVLVLGAFTAVVQVNRSLGDLAGVWLVPRTWLLFLLYLAVPLVLFWFLDRTSAITDTSLFAAALVGLGYAGIMNGSNQAFRTANLSQFWTPFLAYANEVSKVVLQRTKREEDRLVERVVASIIEQSSRYTALENLALRFAPDPVALRARLNAIDATAAPVATGATGAAGTAGATQAAPPTGTRKPHEILEDKARLLFTLLAGVPDAFYLMKTHNIISNKTYWFEVKSLRRIIQYVVGLLVFILAASMAVYAVHPDVKRLRADYYVWRLVKTNATGIDQERAREKLLTLMRDPSIKQAATAHMADLLRRPGVTVQRIDLILQTMLESNAGQTGNLSLPETIVPALRTASVDVRSRINDVLKYLAKSCPTKFVEESPWKPSDGDATTTLEARIQTWTDYWTTQCKKAP